MGAKEFWCPVPVGRCWWVVRPSVPRSVRSWRGVRRGRRVAVVEGEAGIGNTCIVEAAIDLARGAGMDVLSSKAEEFQARCPFGVMADLVGWDFLDEPPARRSGVCVLTPVGKLAVRVAERLLEMLDVSCSGRFDDAGRSRTSSGPIRPPWLCSPGWREASSGSRWRWC